MGLQMFCMLFLKSDVCQPNPQTTLKVKCGSHNANTCAACPEGNGASWCNGDCQWGKGQCQPKEWCARLYENGNYKGWTQEIHEEDQVEISKDRNDELSAVKVKNGCKLYLYRDYGLNELVDIVTKHNPFLKNYNDQISSLKCECKGHHSYKKYFPLYQEENYYKTLVGRYKFITENYKAKKSYSQNISKQIGDLTNEVDVFLVAFDLVIEDSKHLHRQTQQHVETIAYFPNGDYLIETVKKLANRLKNISQLDLDGENSEGIKKQAELILEKCTALEKTLKEGKGGDF